MEVTQDAIAAARNLVERIEAALDAADAMHDLALRLNDGIEAKGLAEACRNYKRKVRGLDLRQFARAPENAADAA